MRAADVNSDLLNLARKRAVYHRWWMVASVFCLPVSLAVGLLPGPNVFIVYNAFRTHANYNAWRGAQSLSELCAIAASSPDTTAAMVISSSQAGEGERSTNLKYTVSSTLDGYVQPFLEKNCAVDDATLQVCKDHMRLI